MSVTVEKIAPGRNHPDDLLTLRQLEPPNFRRYRWPILTEWNEAELSRNDMLGLPTLVGLPWVVWVFARLTQDEYQLLKALVGDVTLYNYHKTEQRWAYFNGIFILRPPTPDNWRDGFWVNIRPEIRQLEEFVP